MNVQEFRAWLKETPTQPPSLKERFGHITPIYVEDEILGYEHIGGSHIEVSIEWLLNTDKNLIEVCNKFIKIRDDRKRLRFVLEKIYFHSSTDTLETRIVYKDLD